MANDALGRLAALAGIEEGWTDFFGQYHPVPEETRRKFLQSMGFALGSEEEILDQIREVEERPWRRWLEPVQVCLDRDGPPTVSVSVPELHEHDQVRWTLAEECGAVHQGHFRPFDLPMTDERVVGGVLHRRHSFRLPGTPLPGVHVLRMTTPDRVETEMTLIVAPSRAYCPDAVAAGGKLWGYATQLYSLRSERGWGIGDFTDLATLAAIAGRQGASAIGVNPLHALFPSQPARFSPYSPSSRLLLNTLYLDVEAVADFAESMEARRLFASPGFQGRLAAAQNARLVDYQNVAPLKLTILECCYRSFRSRHLAEGESERGRAFRAFQRQSGRDGEHLATFDALQEFFLGQDLGLGYWRRWPEQYQDANGPEAARFAEENRERVEFYWYLQWLAEEQLAAAQAACGDAGMAVGVYRDLGVGIAGDGAEAWANRDLLCLDVSVGAPPDLLNLVGQDWGLVPFNPIALREAAYRPFLKVLEANMSHAGAMRLDHAMGLRRLYWVPAGARADQGAYVRYPEDDLFALVMLASWRKRCMVIGEDLGTVPEGFRPHMEEAGLFGYRLMVFERDDRGFRPASAYPAQALVSFGTHDLPSLAAWWRGADVAARRRLKLYPDPAMAPRDEEQRAADRRAMIDLLAAEGLIAQDFSTDPDIGSEPLKTLAAAVYAFLRRSPARLLMVQIEDALALPTQMNLPGTTIEHPNWRFRYPVNLEDLLADDGIGQVVGAL